MNRKWNDTFLKDIFKLLVNLIIAIENVCWLYNAGVHIVYLFFLLRSKSHLLIILSLNLKITRLILKFIFQFSFVPYFVIDNHRGVIHV